MVSGDLKSDTSENADASNTTLADHSLHHVRMNAIADYYNIAKLAELTRSRIQQLPLDKWDPHVCLEVTRNALDLTGDRAFHKTMALVVAQNIRELLTMEQLGEIINDFGIDVLRHRTQRFEVDEGRLRLQLLQLQEELRMEQVRRESSEARADRIIENIKQCMQSLVDRAICRNNNCRAQFDCYIEQRGQTFEPLFTLRCAACRCRH